MTRPPSRLWSAVESVPGLAAVQSEWSRLLGIDRQAAWRFFAPTQFRVETFPCPSPGGDGCPRRVVEHDDGFEAICGDTPTQCLPILLTAGDLVIYEADMATLGRGVAAALGITRFAFSSTGISQTWGLGGHGPIAAEALPVYLTIPTGKDAFRRTVTELVTLSEGAFLLLSPTSKMAGLPTIELLKRRKASFAALDDLLDLLPDGRFEAVKTLDALGLPGGLSKPATKTENTHGNIFRRSGDMWTLSYRGKMVHLRHARGLWLLAQLLRAPRSEIHAAQIEALERGESAPQRLGCSGEILDGKALGAYQSRVSEIQSEMEEATRFNDRGRKDRLQDELEMVASQIMSARGLGGRSRRATDDSMRARKATSNSITRSIAMIRRSHPDLADHLDRSVRLGQFLVYEPEVELAWDA